MPVKPVTKEETLKGMYEKVVKERPETKWMTWDEAVADGSMSICLQAMDSWAALQTAERDERILELERNLRHESASWYSDLLNSKDKRIKELENGLEDLIAAIPSQTNDKDWWPDSLTTAVETATQLLNPTGINEKK